MSMMLVASGSLAAHAAVSPVNGQYFFTGEPNDQANKAATPTATFSKDAPEGAAPITQTASPNCNSDLPANPLCVFWQGDYTGDIYGNMEFCWYWSTTNATANVVGLDLEVTVFADPALSGDAETSKIIGRSIVSLEAPTPEPQQYKSVVPVQGTVNQSMIIQVRPNFVDTGQGNSVYYGTPDFASAFGPEGGSCAPGGGGGGGGGTLSSPKATLGFKDTTPQRGTVVKAKAGLRTCNAQTKGTKIQLQKKVNGVFKPVDTNKLDSNCRTIFKVNAKFKKAVFRSFWPKQSPKYKSGQSKPQTVTTHR
jgi:hypothetical protein